MTGDPRMQVVLGLLPADAVFLQTLDSGHLLWRPQSAGYVSEYNPWQAGFYEGESSNPTHSRAIKAAEYLDGYRIQDGTPVAVLVDEIVKLRGERYFARVFAALATEGRLSEASPTPWTVERIDDYGGPNTEHAWRLLDDVGDCIDILCADVDGPAFVAWINSVDTLTTLFITRGPP